jgi:hypothetical protein
MITKISEFKLILERVNIPDIPINDLYLIVNNKLTTIEFIIQDKSKIYGYAELTKQYNHYYIVNVAAENKYGPLLYDTIMLYLDKPVRPNRSLTHQAYNVWNNYLNNREDVTKIPCENIFNSIDLDNAVRKDKTLTEVINNYYTINNPNRKQQISDWYEKSLTFQNEMISKLPDWLNIRFKTARKWFLSMYI